MTNLEGDNIRMQDKDKAGPFAKDVATPAKFMLGNNSNDRISSNGTS